MGPLWQELRPGSESLERPLFRILERFYQTHGHSAIESDPIQFAHRFEGKLDQEVVAFLSAVFAFGNVATIFETVEKLLKLLGKHPATTLTKGKPFTIEDCSHIYHRWIRSADICSILNGLRDIYSSYGSLESLMGKRGLTVERMNAFGENLQFAFMSHSREGKTKGLQFVWPTPKGKSACKRPNLFFRWVVRSEYPDLGIWSRARASELFMPMDTHLSRLVKYLGLTARKNVDWKFVEEVTGQLKILRPDDPTRYDFSLARLGILKKCRHQFVCDVCSKCPIHEVCSLWLDSIDATSYP